MNLKKGRRRAGRGSTICWRLALGARWLLVQAGVAGGTRESSRGRKDKGHVGDAGREQVQTDFRAGGPGLGPGSSAAGLARRTKRRRRARSQPAAPPPGARPTAAHASTSARAMDRNGGCGGRRKAGAGVGRGAVSRCQGAAPPVPRRDPGRGVAFPALLLPTAPTRGAWGSPGGEGVARSVNKGDGPGRRGHCGAKTFPKMAAGAHGRGGPARGGRGFRSRWPTAGAGRDWRRRLVLMAAAPDPGEAGKGKVTWGWRGAGAWASGARAGAE